MSREAQRAYGDPIYRFHINQWLKRQPTTELVEHPDGLVCVDLTHGWAVMVMAKHDQGPHINVLLADLERALGFDRCDILEAVERGKTVRQMRFEQDDDRDGELTDDDARVYLERINDRDERRAK